jgi:hypothetical protein
METLLFIDLNTDNSGAVVGRDCMVVGYTTTYAISAYHL